MTAKFCEHPADAAISVGNSTVFGLQRCTQRSYNERCAAVAASACLLLPLRGRQAKRNSAAVAGERRVCHGKGAEGSTHVGEQKYRNGRQHKRRNGVGCFPQFRVSWFRLFCET